ncbi:MAG: hypothetical protein KDA22_15660, partial [Phycisphaerales bacterium]|nr:hypothetical protein [Phycisphaerales bacterium]
MLLAAVAIGAGILAWSSVLSWYVATVVGAAFGGDAQIGSMEYLGQGRFRIHELRVNAPGWTGEAAEVLRIQSVELDVDNGALLRGDLHIDNVDIAGMLIRVAERVEDPGKFNLTALRFAPRAPDDNTPLPTVTVHDCRFEMVTLSSGVHEVVGSRRFAGILTRVPDAPELMTVALAEIDDAGHPLSDGLDVDVTFRRGGGTLRASLKRFVLDERTWSLLPIWLRVWREELALQGEVESAQFEMSDDRPVRGSLSIRNAAMQLPSVKDGQWSRFANGVAEPVEGRPRLTMRSGTITLDGSRLQFDRVTGELLGSDTTHPLVGVPFKIAGSLEVTSPMDLDRWEEWADHAAELAAFTMDFEMPEFRVQPDADGETPAVELPTVLAEAIERFDLRAWTLSLSMRIARGAPAENTTGTLEAAPIKVAGQAFINNAAGSYFRFAYPLTDARASLRFSDETIEVEYLTAKGSGDAEISIS